MRTITDDHGRPHLFGPAPKRVVSLVPSDTLSVADLGCAGALVGRTDYCVLPEEVAANVPSVGGTKNPNVEAICALEPDLILANREENTRSDLEQLVQRGFRVYIAFPKRVADGLAHLARLARIFSREGDADVRAMLKEGYEAVRAAEATQGTRPLLATFCPIWMKPLMTIHGTTFISDMMLLAGASNVFADRERKYPLAADLRGETPLTSDQLGGRDTRYPRVTMEEVELRNPELILLPDEPHPFSEEDAAVFRSGNTRAAKRDAIVKCDGKDLCWYGSRSVKALPRLTSLIDSRRLLS